MGFNRRRPPVYAGVVTAALIAAVFAATVFSPDSLATWLLYLVPIGASFWLNDADAPIWVAGLCAVLTFAALPVQHRSEVPLQIVLTNRGIEAVMFIAAGFTLAAYRRLSDGVATQRDHLAQAQAVAHVGSWETEIATGAITWSTETHRIFGTDPRSFFPTYAAFLEMVHAEDRARVDSAFTASTETREECQVEHRIITAGGEVKVVEERWQMMFSARGTPLRAVGTVHDLTIRKAAEAERELLAANLIATLESTTDAFCSLDRDWRLTYVNAQAERFLRRSREELLGRSMWDNFDPGEFQEFRQSAALAFEGRSSQYERFYRPYGRWFRVRVFPSRDGLSAYFQDITEERQAQRSLEHQARLIDEARDAIMVRDLDDRVVFWSRGCELVLGWAASEAVDRPLHDLVRIDPQAYAEAKREAVETGSWTGILEKRDRNGTVHVMDCRWQLTRDDRNRPAGILAIDSDITARRALEQRLRGVEKRYRALVESANDAIIAFSLDWVITDWNRSATRLFGYTAEEMIGGSAARLIPLDKQAEVAARKQRVVLEGTGVRDLETVRLRKDGTRVPVSITMSLMRDAAGRASGISLITRDLTERQRATDQLRALSRRLESAQDDERSALARELHDELGQSLTVLRLEAGRLARLVHRDAAASELLREMTSLIDSTTQQARSIARALHPTALEDLGLAAAIDMQARHVARRSGLELFLDLEEVEPVDRSRAAAVYRVFQESLTNVIRHANARAVAIRLRREAGGLTLDVTDDGSGINEAATAPLSSLGLLGMQERAAAFDGSVVITPADPRGTRVRLHLPLPGARSA